MKKYIVCLLALFISGCMSTNPYPYTISPNFSNINKSDVQWCLTPLQKHDKIKVSELRLKDLTKAIGDYLNTKEVGTKLIDLPSNQASTETISNGCYVIIPKIIATEAEMEQDIAGWHGITEDAVGFWSHFGGGRGVMKVDGYAEAASLFIEIYSNGAKVYENAGGIELTGKLNKFSFRTTPKKDFLKDDKKFTVAMDIAFEPFWDPSKIKKN